MKLNTEISVHRPHRAMSVRGNTASVIGALPWAISAGIMLGNPAGAQTVLSTDQHTTVDLANYPANAPFSISAGTTIAPMTGDGLDGTGAGGAVGNAGTILSAGGAGVFLAAGGTVSNSAAGSISAGGYGVVIQRQAGQVSNAGFIGAGFDGISLDGGGVALNDAGGTISAGHIGVYIANGGASLTNGGVILAAGGDAVSLYSGGDITNLAGARLIGGYSGVYIGGAGGSIQNAGVIGGPDFGVYLTGHSVVSNTGTIAGGIDGLVAVGAGTNIVNTGLIQGGDLGVRLFGSGSLQNSGTISGGVTGARLANGDTLSNLAGGLIEGGSIGLLAGDGVVINNAGAILDDHLAGAVLGSGDQLNNTGSISGVSGILVSGNSTSITDQGSIAASQPGGYAVVFQGNDDRLTLQTGAELTGGINASGSGDQINLLGNGEIESNITGFGNNGAIRVAPGAAWTASGSWTIQSVTNDGTLQPGVIGTPLALTGNFTQSAGGAMLVYVTPAATTQFVVTGTASLAGKLIYMLAPGSYAPVSEGFLTATGGISGAFASIASTPAAASSAASTRAITSSLAGQPPSSPVTLAVVGGARGQSLVITRAFTVAPADDVLVAEAGQAASLAAMRSGDQLLGHAIAANASACAPDIAPQPGGSPTELAAALAGAFCRSGGWIEASRASLRVDGGYDSQDPGVMAGIDRPIGAGGARVGVAVGYDNITLRDVQGGGVRIGTVRFGLYGMQPVGGLILAGDVEEGLASETTARPAGAGTANGKVDGNDVEASVQIAAPVVLGPVAFLPQLGVRLTQVAMGDAREQAAQPGFALRSAAYDDFAAQPYIRMEIGRRFLTASGFVLAPSARLGLDYRPGGDQPVTVHAADGTGFSASPTRLDPVAGTIGAGLSAKSGRWTLSAGYGASVSGNWNEQTAEAEMMVVF